MLIPKTKAEAKRRYWLVGIISLILVSIFIIFYLFIRLDYFAERYYQANFPGMLEQYEVNGDGAVDYASLITSAAAHALKSHVGAYDNADIESININIKFKHIETLKAKRNEALNETIFLFATDDDFVPAVIDYRNKKVRVRLRLKGDGNEHLKDPKKWSFRVKTRKGAEFMGMRRFSIQHPKTRGYTYEALFHHVMRDLGVLGLRYDFINVSINGESIGVMALEEHFSKELLESQERKDGLIFKASEDNYWKYHLARVMHARKRDSEGQPRWPDSDLENAQRTYTNGLNVPFEVYRANKVGESEELSALRRYGIGLLRAMVNESLRPSEVFDADQVGAFAAGLWFWESHHPSNFVNVRYYLNPYTLKFEIIAFDANAHEQWTFRGLYAQEHGRQQMQLLMRDSDVQAAFKRYSGFLYDKVKSGYVEELKEVADGYRAKLALEYPLLPRIDFAGLKKNIQESYPKIQRGEYFLEADPSKQIVEFPADFDLPSVVHAYLVKTDKGWQLELQNILVNEVSITSLDLLINDELHTSDELLGSQLPITLPATRFSKPADRVVLPLVGLADDDSISVYGQAKLLKQGKIFDFESIPYEPELDEHPLSPDPVSDLLNSLTFLSFDSENRVFTIPEGNWQVERFWIFPKRHSLHINPGAVVSFDKGAGFLVNGGTKITGTSEEPVILKSTLGGADFAWAGLAFINGEKSEWSHVEVRNTDYTQVDGWRITGAVTFYKTDIELTDVQFINTTAEDALNIVHSQFKLENVEIRYSRSDGFDSDFSTGNIKDSNFANIGGDAIDFSGSQIEISKSEFHEIGDKAISAGEKSTLNITNAFVRNAGTGAVSKDNSTVRIENSRFEGIQHSALMSYIKKPEYGGSALSALNLQFDTPQPEFMAQTGSKLSVDGVMIKPVDFDVEELYESYMKK